MATDISFQSDGLALRGTFTLPGGLAPEERRAAVVVLHGFGSNRGDGVARLACKLFDSLGYVTLRFDMRGCGESEGEAARVLCEEQVADTQNAVTWLQAQPGVDASRIAVMGHSFGAAVAVYAAGVDERIAACISSAGWGDGEVKLRQQHASEDAWSRFSTMLAQGREKMARGEPMRVPRFDIVPIPPALRSGLPAGSFMDFPFEVVESMFRFKPNQMAGRIAPRPLLLLHPSNDSVTPTAQSIELFRHAGMPTDLHLFAGIDHFIFSDDNTMALNLIRDWMHKHLPARAEAAA
jgi:dipeptidyl aminopeptidase/acylaminoacyl peptidase